MSDNNKSATILIADDNPTNLDIFETRLATHGYSILTARDGAEALTIAKSERPDLILLDIMMPKMDGIEVCRRLKQDPEQSFTPIILVTAKADAKDVVTGLEAGAEEYLTKPVDQTALVARVRSMLRIKALHDKNVEQAEILREQADKLAEWNLRLEERVAVQVAELERLSQLKQFFCPQVAEALLDQKGRNLMESHRCEVTAVCCDLREFTAFSEAAEPEEVMEVLKEFHAAVGPLMMKYEATLEHFAGDGLICFFNDPVPCPDPAHRGVRMAVEMREAVGEAMNQWARRGFELGFGVGVALGYATLGQIGWEGRFHYGAIGSVLNLASRLCDRAQSGQVLISRRVANEVEQDVELEDIGDLVLKGFAKPVPVFNVLSVSGLSDT